MSLTRRNLPQALSGDARRARGASVRGSLDARLPKGCHPAPLRSLAAVLLLLSTWGCGSQDEACGSQDEAGRLEGLTAAHNEARSDADPNMPLVTWDPELSCVAQDWANHLAKSCALEHSSSGYGENIFAAWGSDPTAQEVVGSWVSEKAAYDYSTNSCLDVCGHYTQVVWADSTRLGCGRADCEDGSGGEIWVCNYDPPGNFVGQKPY